MANLNLGQDVANKRETKKTAAQYVAKSFPLYLAVGMRRYGSLININSSGKDEKTIRWSYTYLIARSMNCAM